MAPKTTKASAHTQQGLQGPQIGTIVVTKVAYDHVPVHSNYGDTGMTIGSLVDEQLARHAHEHTTVQKVEFHVYDEVWNDLAKHIRQTQRNPMTGEWASEATEALTPAWDN